MNACVGPVVQKPLRAAIYADQHVSRLMLHVCL